MTPQEKDRLARAVSTWFALCKQNGREMPEDHRGLYADLMHSALLERLLDGKDPHPDPPPVSYSYPWYQLVEQGHAETMQVSFWPAEHFDHEDDLRRLVPGAHLNINQALWPVFETVGPEEWVVGYYCPRKSKNVHESRWRVRFVRFDERFTPPRKVWEVRREPGSGAPGPGVPPSETER